MVRIALNRELQILHSLLYEMAKVVDEMVRGVIFSYQKRDRLRAEEIIKLDDQVDHYEHLINITALEIFALQQPVARDLRRVISVLEIAKNLERTADQAVNIAEMILEFEEEGELIEKKCGVEISPMARESLSMLEDAMKAYLEENKDSAMRVLARDDLVDAMKEELRQKLEACLNNGLIGGRCLLNYFVIVENLERIADLACNIAEAVIFVIEGQFMRGLKEKKPTLEVAPALEESLTFQLMKRHLRLIKECLDRLHPALSAYFEEDMEKVEEIDLHIRDIEREADKIKTSIRSHLPKGLILPVEKFELFLYLKEQDSLADLAEELLNLFMYHQIKISEALKEEFLKLLEQSLEAVSPLEEIVVKTLGYLTNWREEDRERAKELIRKVRETQFITEERTHKLKLRLYREIDNLKDLLHGERILDVIAKISSRAENTVDLLRAMLAR
ncbi:phosphate uptake regulator PhoU [Caldimicrobium thiodismutans]|uniref:Phosphate uptake regulator PhoU n=2 Tax=Caldimicrobium thiodismutans TaxID=1653476 RepID=A0A0U5AZY7_9BACT|nr:phosphate uptake regulator PhoU [Caldimicrobium thiodismutans]